MHGDEKLFNDLGITSVKQLGGLYVAESKLLVEAAGRPGKWIEYDANDWGYYFQPEYFCGTKIKWVEGLPPTANPFYVSPHQVHAIYAIQPKPWWPINSQNLVHYASEN